MNAAIIKLDTLAYAIGAAAEDHHLPPFAWFGLAFGWPRAVSLVDRVHISCLYVELGGAGINPLVDRPDLQCSALVGNLARRITGQFRQACVGEAHFLEVEQAEVVVWQTVSAKPRLGLDDGPDLI